MTMPRAFLRGAIFVAVVLLMSGCAPTSTPKPQETKAMSTATARSEVFDLYTATKDHLGGSWKVGAQEWQDCTTASGSSGADFDFISQRLAQSLTAEPELLTDEVRVLWRKQGVRATVSVDKSLTPPHYILSDPVFGAGKRDDGFLVQLTVSENDVTFTGTSRCVPGDVEKLNSQE